MEDDDQVRFPERVLLFGDRILRAGRRCPEARDWGVLLVDLMDPEGAAKGTDCLFFWWPTRAEFLEFLLHGLPFGHRFGWDACEYDQVVADLDAQAARWQASDRSLEQHRLWINERFKDRFEVRWAGHGSELFERTALAFEVRTRLHSDLRRFPLDRLRGIW